MRFKSCLLFVLLLSGPALATSNVCKSGSAKQGYQTGFNLQKNVIKYLWQQVFHSECHEMEAFISAVDNSFSPSKYGGSLYLQCRDEGLITGLSSAVSEIQQSCGQYCIESGESSGRLFAKQFCGVVETEQALSQMTEGINVCETFSVQACRTALRAFVNGRSSCKAKAQEDPAEFDNFVDNIACASP